MAKERKDEKEFPTGNTDSKKEVEEAFPAKVEDTIPLTHDASEGAFGG